MNQYIYLDNAAAMEVDLEMVDRLALYSREFFPNPEAVHHAGRAAKKELELLSKNAINSLVGNNSDYSIFWTTSATEAMNLTFLAPFFKNSNIVTTNSEHPSIYNPIDSATNSLSIVKINSNGALDIEDFKKKLSPKTFAVVIHHVQNETGAIQDLILISNVIKECAPDALFIVDTVQSIGKIDIPWIEAGINIAFVGGHKIGLSTGGALIYKFKDKMQNRAFENYLLKIRSDHHLIGRVDTPIALTLADAIEKVVKKRVEHVAKIIFLNELLREKLSNSDIDVKFLIPTENASPYILTILLPGYQGEVLVRMFSDKGVMVSEGSACAAATKNVSEAILALGVPKWEVYNVLRISFGFFSVESDVNVFISTLDEIIADY
jgi:cysteine desulfurase